MPVLINFKICDNSKDCSGIEVCPTGAFFWNEDKNKIDVNEAKCDSCGLCEENCEVFAIRVAKTNEEYEQIKKEIDADPRQVADLFIDRYGASPIQKSFQINQDRFDITVLQSEKLAVVEAYDLMSIRCLLTSIPVKDLFSKIDIVYRKMEITGKTFVQNYGVEDLPALLFFRKGKLIGKIEGYFSNEDKHKLKRIIKSIIDDEKIDLL